MSKEFSLQQKKEAFAKLPESVKDVIDDFNVSLIVLDLGKEYNLTVDKMGFLDERINLVIVGLIDSQTFLQDLQENIDLSQENLNNLIKDINSKIFEQIRLELVGSPDDTESSFNPAFNTNNIISKNESIVDNQKELEDEDLSLMSKESLLMEIEGEKKIDEPIIDLSDTPKKQEDKQEEIKLLEEPDKENVEIVGPEKVTTQTTNNTPKNPFQQKSAVIEKQENVSSDPYREPVE